jgi:hypothetical protein
MGRRDRAAEGGEVLILRGPEVAERELSNAIAAINETLTSISRNCPLKADSVGDHWRRQLAKLRRARGLCEKVQQELEMKQRLDARRAKTEAE